MLGVAALAGFLQQDFKLTAAETGLLITATYGAAVFSLLFVGDLLDRKSERMIIGVGGTIAFIALHAGHPQRRFRRASVVPVRRRLRLQRDPARRQQIGIGLVSRRPAGLGDGHPSGRTAAWRRAGGGDLARGGGGIELAHRVRGRRGGDARRRVRFRTRLPAARRGRRCRVQACGLERRRGRRIAAPVVDAQRHDRRARSGQRAIRHPDLADALSARPCPYRADARRLVSGAGASRPASPAASVLRPGATARRRGAFACCRCA